jgi:hypothetical protein
MRFIKTLSLAMVAAAALMAFAGLGTASATVLCKEIPAAGTDCANPYPAGTKGTGSAETSILLKTSGGTTIVTCTSSTVTGQSVNQGSTTETVKSTLTTLTFSNCTTTVTVLSAGTGELHHIAGTNNGTLTTTGTEVTITFLGVSCIFKTNSTDVGTATGGKPGTFDLSATIPGVSGGFCPASGILSGSYIQTEPTTGGWVAAG